MRGRCLGDPLLHTDPIDVETGLLHAAAQCIQLVIEELGRVCPVCPQTDPHLFFTHQGQADAHGTQVLQFKRQRDGPDGAFFLPIPFAVSLDLQLQGIHPALRLANGDLQQPAGFVLVVALLDAVQLVELDAGQPRFQLLAGIHAGLGRQL